MRASSRPAWRAASWEGLTSCTRRVCRTLRSASRPTTSATQLEASRSHRSPAASASADRGSRGCLVNTSVIHARLVALRLLADLELAAGDVGGVDAHPVVLEGRGPRLEAQGLGVV